MPSWLPVSALFSGIITTFLHAIKLWLHYSLVALCWLAFVPLVSFRTYKCLFSGSIARKLQTYIFFQISFQHFNTAKSMNFLIVHPINDFSVYLITVRPSRNNTRGLFQREYNSADQFLCDIISGLVERSDC